ncbi:MAG: HEAT repeat domain-containing protein, partial [Chlamydiales bacterium]|nr:HEAT repeat domain-containing protein [Chlamydiales bacterium]
LSSLAVVEDPRALDALKSFLQRKSWGVTGVAAATLLREGDEHSLEIVRELLKDQDPNVRLQACLVLAMMGRDETVVKELESAYSGASHERKLHILEALGRIGHMDSLHFLTSTLQEPFPILRICAAAALIQTVNR